MLSQLFSTLEKHTWAATTLQTQSHQLLKQSFAGEHTMNLQTSHQHGPQQHTLQSPSKWIPHDHASLQLYPESHCKRTPLVHAQQAFSQPKPPNRCSIPSGHTLYKANSSRLGRVTLSTNSQNQRKSSKMKSQSNMPEIKNITKLQKNN